MRTVKTNIHFADSSLHNATNPISVNLIGAGGTGSKVLTALMEMNESLTALGHPGLQVRLWDDDEVSQANIGRQRFAESEIGLNKAVALINRANRWSGTFWKAETQRFETNSYGSLPNNAMANIFISCVDNVKSRFGIAEILRRFGKGKEIQEQPLYWMDFGNGRNSGQVILSTIGDIEQPSSEKYNCVPNLPFVTDEFGEMLRQSEETDDTPSCSLAEALTKQDLYINGSLAQMGCSLLWNLFREGTTRYRGFFFNLKEFRLQPIKIG
ncbi:PRTRC system ThiF family protein [Flavobacterium lindanitolerans]|uniref:PRTRC system ThiF family protein n=1 Tax=Flavobacterium lindanitolerans TaxID=428988 RepID=UPI0023F4ED6F|nr:PRTRC system ThiF family protein [Flavobacterium lindanitolerans]